ncbi:MAG: BamA/TamA family outer membrane protein [Alphaproteobacteria bacterium]|nr:BamA/TamA family outer membrane protein [Alphaproteobacteria bacterium]
MIQTAGPRDSQTRRRHGLRIGSATGVWASLALYGVAEAAERYDIKLEGAPEELRERLLALSDLAREERAFPTSAAVRRAGRNDALAIANALKASGYYKATARLNLVTAEGEEKINATIVAEPGPRYEIAEHVVVFLDDGPEDRPRSASELGVDTTPAPNGEALAAVQRALVQGFWNAGYPQARAVGRKVELIGGSARARAIYEIESGPRASFGQLELQGTRRTDEDYLRKLATWRDGEQFDQGKLIAFQNRLIATNIFSSVDVAPGAPDDDGEAPVVATVEERKPRTFGVGVSFSTVEGVGGRLFLEYRNVFGAGETARFDVAASEIEQEATVTFNKPFPVLPGSAYASTSFTNSTTEAFDARTFSIGAGVSKFWFERRLETRGGISLETSRIEAEGVNQRTYFVSFPLLAVWDTEDDPLALSKGARASVSLTPYFGSSVFTQAELAARTRRNFGNEEKFTVAGRVRVGSIFGAGLDDIPLDRRFYSGGGSSVRGYDFQAVGPLLRDTIPIGGRSVVEAALETRYKVTSSIQAAAFIDAGTVSSQSTPDIAGDYLVGAGVGARYLSAIGPLRVDFALPLERRSSDRAWQLYISLGQPF